MGAIIVASRATARVVNACRDEVFAWPEIGEKRRRRERREGRKKREERRKAVKEF